MLRLFAERSVFEISATACSFKSRERKVFVMKRISIVLGLIMLFFALIYACGGGGGGGATPTLSFSTFQPASIVIGQPTFTGNLPNQSANPAALPAANTLNSPYGNPLVDAGKLYVPDCGNHRVLVFNSVPTTNNASASFVLGQPDMVSTGTGTAADRMSCPQTVRASNGKLFVDEYGNSRVMIFSLPSLTTNGVPAEVVVGQAGYDTPVTDCTGTTLFQPEDIAVAGGKLIVADSNHNRVLIWNSIPTTNGVPADVVLGQSSFTSCVANDTFRTGATGTASAETLNYPAGLWSDGTRLIVADSFNNRILIWSSFPASSSAPADIVLGQNDFTHRTGNDDLQSNATGTATARTFFFPYLIDSNGNQLFAVDSNNNRVLIWNSIPTANFTPADIVLGQGDFAHIAGNDDDQNNIGEATPTARTLSGPNGIHVYGTRLFVVEGNNHRLLMYEKH
jgi:hypothetical protein